METAFVMMLVMPKREGGLGIRGLEMDYRIEVSSGQASYGAQLLLLRCLSPANSSGYRVATDSSTMTRCRGR